MGNHEDQIKVYDLMKNVSGLSEENIGRLRTMKYFTVPASTKYHGSYQGGLCSHSLKVYETASAINKTLNLGVDERSIALCALFHDLNKVYAYKQDGDGKYKWDASLLGDGDLSANILIATLKLDLNTAEYHAIRFHNVFEGDYKEKWFNKLYTDFPKEYRLCWLIQTSDMFCATVIQI